MSKLPQNALFATSRGAAALGARSTKSAGSGTSSGPQAQTQAEKTVQFINAEVLDPPEQGKISFMGPYVAQVGAMALEDARSFLQGAEQILLVALAKALSEALGTSAPGAPKGNLRTSEGAPDVDALAKALTHAAANDDDEPPAASPQPARSEQGPTTETNVTDADEIADNDETADHVPEDSPPTPYTAHTSPAPGHTAGPNSVELIQGVMTTLAEFHSSIAESALKLQGDK